MRTPRWTTGRRLAALAALTVATAAANVWIARHRLEGYAHRFASFATIHEPLEEPAIARLARGDGELELWLARGAAGTWTLRAAGVPVESAGAEGRLRLRGQGSAFSLSPAGGRAGATRALRADASGGLLATSDLLVGPPARRPLAELTSADGPPEELAAARELLRRHAGLAPWDGTEARLRKVWSFLFRDLDRRRGRPPAWLEALPVFAQYRHLLAGTAGGWCNTFARIFVLFAQAAGLPARVVDAGRRLDGVDLSAHTFCEVYIPETQRWAFTDLTLGVLWVRDRESGLTLSAVQLMHLLEAKATGGLVASAARQGRLEDGVPFSALGDLLPAYLNQNATFLYHRRYAGRGELLAWLSRYLIAPELAYSLHADSRPHVVKLACFWLLVAQLAAWLGLATQWSLSALRRPRSRPSPA